MSAWGTFIKAMLTVFIATTRPVYAESQDSPEFQGPPKPAACSTLLGPEGNLLHNTTYPFSEVNYRLINAEKGTEVPVDGYLQDSELAIAFGKDGSVHIYYGETKMSYMKVALAMAGMVPSRKPLELNKYEVILIYRDLPEKIHQTLYMIANSTRERPYEVFGFNCVSAACSILEVSEGEYIDKRVLLPHTLLKRLLESDIKRDGLQSVEVLVDSMTVSPEWYYNRLKKSKDSMGLRAAEFASIHAVKIGGGLLGFYILSSLLAGAVSDSPVITNLPPGM